MEQAKIGEVREFNGKKYIACKEEQEDECTGCAFYDSACWAGIPLRTLGPCCSVSSSRTIIFKEVKEDV